MQRVVLVSLLVRLRLRVCCTSYALYSTCIDRTMYIDRTVCIDGNMVKIVRVSKVDRSLVRVSKVDRFLFVTATTHHRSMYAHTILQVIKYIMYSLVKR